MASRLMRLLLVCLLLAPGLALAQSSAGKVGPLRIETLPNAQLLGSTLGSGLDPVAVGAGLNLSSHTLSANVLSVAGRTGAVTITSSDLADFVPAALAAAPVQSVFGRTGVVTLGGSDVTGALGFTPLRPSSNLSDLSSLSAARQNLLAGGIGGGLTLSTGTISANVISVAGRTGTVTLAAGDVSGLSAAAAAAAPVQSVAGRTGAVTLAAGDVSGLTAAAAAAAPVQSVAGRTGAVTLAAGDVSGLSAAASAAAPVQSVAGRTGAVTLAAGDVSGLNAAASAAAPVQSVAGRTGAVTLTTADVGAGTIASQNANAIAVTGGSLGGAISLGLSVQLPSLMRQPNIRDTCSAVRPVGYFWNDQFNRIWTSQQCSPTAAWALGVGLYSWTPSTQPGLAAFTQAYVGALPCDVATAIACYGMRREKSTYTTGPLFKLIALTDTANTGFDVGQNSDGSPDGSLVAKNCTNTECRFLKWYDQSGNSYDSLPVKAPLVLTSTGTASGGRTVVADSSGIAVNDHITVTGGACQGNTIIASVPDGTHFTTNNGCQVANGVVFMVSKSPAAAPGNLIGNTLSMVQDSQGEWNFGAMMTLPVQVAVNNNATGGVMTFRAFKPARGNGLFSLTQTGGTGNALTFWTQDGTMRGRTFDGGGWNLPSTAGLYLTASPQVAAWQSDITGQAFPNFGLWIDEKFFSMGFTGSTTLAGGYIGGAVSTGASGAGGGLEIANFVVYSVNPTTAQLAAARAASYATHGLCPQCNQFRILIGPDSLVEGPGNKYMRSIGRELAELAYPAGGRVVPFGWTGQTNAFNDTNYTAYLGNSYLGTNFATNSIVVWYPSNNDVSGTSCATYWTTTMRSLIGKILASGHKLLLIKIPHMAANQAFLDDCNARIDSDQATYGYAVLDLASHPILGGSGYANTNLTTDGYHPTNLAADIWAQSIWDAIRANGWLPAS